MSNTYSADDRLALANEGPLAELAALLAAGIHRLHARSALGADAPPPEISPNSSPPCLDVPAETVLSVHTG